MEALRSTPKSIAMAITSGIFLLLTFFPFQDMTAQQVSTFSIVGCTPGIVPVFTGAGSNVVNLNYGDSLTTGLLFVGTPEDGLETDHDNVSYMNFSYSYTIYLTPAGSAFSPASIPIGSHTVSASQSCSSGIVPPWNISYDVSAAIQSDSVNLNIGDVIGECIPFGDYQVDVVFNNYSVETGGPSAPPIQLQWQGANSSTSALTSALIANTPTTDLAPVNSYVLGQIGYVHVARPSTCPSLDLVLTDTVHTYTGVASATVTSSYAASCAQNPCTYLWSNGGTNATATHLSPGRYTVTVTAPCGTTAVASVIVSQVARPDMNEQYIADQNIDLTPETHSIAVHHAPINAPINKEIAGTQDQPERKTKQANTDVKSGTEVSIKAYPNPARSFITFDFNTEIGGMYTIRILDISGNEVMRPANEISKEAGAEKLHIYLDTLPTGVYIYELVTDQTISGKFVKQ